jgi:hypothetical protein
VGCCECGNELYGNKFVETTSLDKQLAASQEQQQQSTDEKISVPTAACRPS